MPVMNNGKICVSLCAGTADELKRHIAEAGPLADVVELRLDCLDPLELDEALGTLVPDRPFLMTYRPGSQGGNAPDEMMVRMMFWVSMPSKTDLELSHMWFDNEIDFGGKMDWSEECTIVRSFHDIKGEEGDLGSIFSQLSNGRDIVKIAVTANTATDALPVWQMLSQARESGVRIVPIAMGEAGKWTRILGLAHGAFMTYASLGTGSETAPGQISAEDLTETFRVKSLDGDTRVHGIIAGNTSYSISPWMHNAAFAAAKLDRVFIPLQVADLDEFIRRMVRRETREAELNFAGFSVTNPHKQAIIPYLDRVDDTAAAIGAVNTVSVDGDVLTGYNTDAHGFISPLKAMYGDLRGSNVAVAGAGGAARACIYALFQEGASVSIFAREPAKAVELADPYGFPIFRLGTDAWPTGTDILVNCTPLGTRGSTEEDTVAEAAELEGIGLVYDLVYNPSETRLIREAKAAGAKAIGGLEMLVAQGAKQFEIWTGQPAPRTAMEAAVRKKLNI
ncbi:MAG: shikimate dehydrogenase [Pyrinomonadaceae bacterium]